MEEETALAEKPCVISREENSDVEDCVMAHVLEAIQNSKFVEEND